MWIITGVLLGLVCLVAVFGFHFGPHAHAVAGVIGLLAAGWLVYAVVDGGPGHDLWWLLGADLVVSAGVGVMAWAGLTRSRTASERFHLDSLEGSMGVAVSDLAPEGIVNVRGEQWTAVSVNGTAPASTRVQVLRADGVRLEVWGEEAERGSAPGLFHLEPSEGEDQRT
ncbi:MAG: NfeD family protein [Acidimicrobiales bacterium]